MVLNGSSIAVFYKILWILLPCHVFVDVPIKETIQQVF